MSPMKVDQEKHPLELYEEARTLAERGNVNQALRLYEELLSSAPAERRIRASVYNDLGVIHYAFGDTTKAEQWLIKSIFTDTLFEDPYRNLILVNEGKVSKKFRISIVISTYNRCYSLIDCVEYLRINTFFPLEMVIVCDPCRDGTVEYLRQQEESPDVIPIINRERIGHSKSHNKGARIASGDYICYLNDDVRVMPGWDLSVVVAIDGDTKAGCGVPLVVYPDGRVQSPGQYNPYRSVYFDWIGKVPFIDTSSAVGQFLESSPQFQIPRECDYGYFPVMKRVCFEKVGLYDEQFKHYFVDPDQGYRIQEIGMKNIYCPTSVFVHHELSKQDQEQTRRRAEADMERFVRKWGVYNYLEV